jgi:SagB-type dehydrogenase family enzyme
MQFQLTVSTDSLLREPAESRLFELYHENTKLSMQTAAQYFKASSTPSSIERYLTTRGFRQFHAGEQIALPAATQSPESLQEVMLRRRSGRQLSGPVELCELATLLNQSLGCTAIVEDDETEIVHALRAWPSAGGLYPLDTYVIVRNVTGVPAGVYHYNPITSSLESKPSRPPDKVLSDAFFGQAFAINASVSVFLVASFDRTVAKYGERGYRLVLLDAGHAAQNLLLTAEQMFLDAVAMGGYCDDSLASDLGIDGVSEAVVHSVLMGRST